MVRHENRARSLDAVQQAIRDALEQTDPGALKRATSDADFALLDENQIPDAFFRFLVETTFGPAGLASEGSPHLLHLFQSRWA